MLTSERPHSLGRALVIASVGAVTDRAYARKQSLLPNGARWALP